MTKLTETTYQESAPRIDATQGVLYGVKLLGNQSRNGRRYTQEAMQKALHLYEGRKIYVNHPRRDELGEDRQFESWAGESRNPQLRTDGIYGDVYLRQKSDYFEGIVEAAEKFPKSVGFSHVADGKSRMENGEEIIESITEVFSVDLVTDPATTAGFFESKAAPRKKTLRGTIESLPDGVHRTRLVEMMDAGYLSEPADDEPEDPLSMAYSTISELIAMLGETLKALAMKQETSTVPPKMPAATTATDDTAADQTASPPGQIPPVDRQQFESLQRQNAELKAKSLLLESGREARPAWVKALSALTDESAQQELLESLPQLEEGQRPLTSPPLGESLGIDGSTFSTPEKFAARYR